jgi:hypothetical protein
VQTHGGAAAEKAILSRERELSITLEVDWNRDGLYNHPLSRLTDYVESVTTDRTLKGAAPEEILLIEGSSAAELTATLSGTYNGVVLSSQFSPYRVDSVFYGKKLSGAEIRYKIVVETEDGEVEYSQFVGFVRTVTPDRAEGTVTITALDRAELLRKPIQLPPWAISDEHASYGEALVQMCYSEWVIDHCLRLCDVGMGPKRPTTRAELNVPDDTPDGLMFHMTGNWSILPTVGYIDNLNAWSFANPGNEMYASIGPRHPDLPGPETQKTGALSGLGTPVRQRYGRASDQGILRYWAVDQDLFEITGTHYLGFTLVNSPDWHHNAMLTISDFVVMEIILGWAYRIEVHISAGKVWSVLHNVELNDEVTSSKITLPTDQEFIDVVVNWDMTTQTGILVSVKAGANQTNGWETTKWTDGATFHTDVPTDQIKGRVTIAQALDICDIYFATRNWFNAPPHQTSDMYREPKYLAVLDQGLNRFTHMPTSRAQEAWQVITDVASAEFGAAFWDEEGIFRFWSFNRIESLQDIVTREYSIDDVTGFQLTDSIDSVRNIYTVQTNRKRAVYSGKIFSASDPFQFYVPANTKRLFRIWADDVVSPLTFYMAHVNNAGWSSDEPHGYSCQYLVSDNGDEVWEEFPFDEREGPTVRVYFSSLGYLTVSVYNNESDPVRLATGSGGSSQPAFNFEGTKIVTDATLSVVSSNRESIDKYGPMIMELSGDWMQDQYGTDQVIPKMIERTKEPIPTTDAITVAGDPRLQLADSILIRDPDGFGDALKFQILGINRTFDRDSGLTDVLAIEAVRTSVPEVVPANPAELLWIGDDPGKNHFAVQVSRSGDASILTKTQLDIEGGYSEDPYFKLTDDAKAVQLWAPLDGPKTSSSAAGPRCELRELNPDGTNAAWDWAIGEHWIIGRTKITGLPDVSKALVIAQAFNGNADGISIRTQLISSVPKLLFRINGTSTGLPRFEENYALGTEFQWAIRFLDGDYAIYYNDMVNPIYSSFVTGAPVLQSPAGPAWYFKAGAYTQPGTGESLADYGSVEMTMLQHWHNGWATPTQPVFTGTR